MVMETERRLRIGLFWIFCLASSTSHIAKAAPVHVPEFAVVRLKIAARPDAPLGDPTLARRGVREAGRRCNDRDRGFGRPMMNVGRTILKTAGVEFIAENGGGAGVRLEKPTE